ncbi:MAG: 50S ribosomal protein L21e [Candidatus Aenigmatarchaeota archaeon]
MKKSGGTRQGTRKKLKKGPREKNTVNQFLKEFQEGENARIKIEPSSHSGMPDMKFDGRIGRIKEKRGNSYVLEVSDGNSKKTVIANPEHLEKA